MISWKNDSSDRVLSLLIDYQGFCINIINIYAPTNLTDRKLFFENIHEFFIPANNRYLAGDFDCYDYILDKFGGNVSLQNELSRFKSDFRFVDIWSKLHPRSCEFTWFNSDFSIGSRLDKFYISSSPVNSVTVTSSAILPCCFSDHGYTNLVV